MRQIQRSLQTFVRSLALLWLATPGATVFLLVSRLLQGLAPAASIWIVKEVVDTVSAALNQGVFIGRTRTHLFLYPTCCFLLC